MNSYSQAQAADRFDPGHGTLSDGSISCRNSAGYNLWCSVNNEAVQFQPWVMDYAHFALFSYVPYLITGDWYFLENQQFAAAYFLGRG